MTVNMEGGGNHSSSKRTQEQVSVEVNGSDDCIWNNITIKEEIVDPDELSFSIKEEKPDSYPEDFLFDGSGFPCAVKREKLDSAGTSYQEDFSLKGDGSSLAVKTKSPDRASDTNKGVSEFVEISSFHTVKTEDVEDASNIYLDVISLEKGCPRTRTKLKKEPLKEKSFRCDICSKRFCDENVLYLHRLRHAVNKPFKCNKCYKTFTKNLYLTMHKKECRFRGVFCEICDRKFTSKATLNLHQRVHILKESKKLSTLIPKSTGDHE